MKASLQEDTQSSSSDSDSDSDYADSIFSEDCASSVLSVLCANPTSRSDDGFHRITHDRRYQTFREWKWTFPDDEKEQDRMQIVDQIMSILLNGELFVSPLVNPHRILDVGTGTGVWAADVADKFPNARVIGTDLSPIQVPPPENCRFDIEDADEPWIYPENYFSMVHTRNLAGGIKNWTIFFTEAFRTLHPNGWAELSESPYVMHTANPAVPDDLTILRVDRLWNAAMKELDIPVGSIVHRFADIMRDVGFVDVEEDWYRLPIGAWCEVSIMREIGRLNLVNFLEGMEAFMLDPFTRVHGMTAEDVHGLNAECSRDIMDRRNQLYIELLVVRGRKPK